VTDSELHFLPGS